MAFLRPPIDPRQERPEGGCCDGRPCVDTQAEKTFVGVWRYLDYDMKSGRKIESMTFDAPAIAAVFRW